MSWTSFAAGVAVGIVAVPTLLFVLERVALAIGRIGLWLRVRQMQRAAR